MFFGTGKVMKCFIDSDGSVAVDGDVGVESVDFFGEGLSCDLGRDEE